MQQKVIQIVIHLLFSVLLFSCRTPVSYSSRPSPATTINGNLPSGEDAAAEAIIKPYREPLTDRMKEVMVISDTAALKGLPESSLGNLVCDALTDFVKNEKSIPVDFCFFNSGGLRIDLPKGEITRSMLYELMPFENLLVVAKVKGEQLRHLLNQIAERNGGPVSGVKMGIRKGLPENALINGEPISNDHVYNVLTSDYLLNGGDKYIFPETSEVINVNVLVREALIEKFQSVKQSGNHLKPAKDGRIYILDTP